MAMSRRDAIDRCVSLGKQFIEHFHKVYTDTDNATRKHHLAEMQNWYDSVMTIKLTTNNKKLNAKNLYEWFFTAGRLVADWFEDEDEIYRYDLFVDLVLDEDMSIYDAWDKSSMYNDVRALIEYYMED